MNRRLYLSLIALSFLLVSRTAQAGQNNFSFSPAPITYPYFEPDRTDSKFTGVYFNLKGKDVNSDINIRGGGLDMAFRHAFGRFIAADLNFGLHGLKGDMPGIALPFFYRGFLFTPILDGGKGSLSGLDMPFSLNLEFQPIKKPFSLILFGGPGWSFDSLTLTTPYHVAGGAKTNYTTDMKMFLGGVQMGIQMGIPLGPLQFVPYFTSSTRSGTANMTFDTGYQDTTSIVGDTSATVDPFTVTATGIDLIISPWNLSVGAMMQQAQPTKDQEGFKTTLLMMSWHFRGS